MAASMTHNVRSFYGQNARSKSVRLLDIPDGSEDEFEDGDNVDDEYVPNEDTIESESDSEVGSEIDSDNESGDEMETNHDNSVPKPGRGRKTFPWKKTKEDLVHSPEFDIPEEKLMLNSQSPNFQHLTKHTDPAAFYLLFLDENYIAEVAFQTNLYITQRTHTGGRKIPPVTKEEIYKVIGIILYMGVVKLPNRRMYWAPDTKISVIADTMPRNRFDDIMSCLHFNDNANQKQPNEEGYNKLFKIQPFIDHLRLKFQDAVIPETYQSIDEMMVAFKGRHGLKQYLPKKPTKWGYKLWARAGASGYVYEFQIYGGNERGPPTGARVPAALGESEFVVLRLIQSLPPGKHKLFFDNFFSCPELLVYLRDQGHYAVSMRQNRLRQCPIMSEKDLKKEGRGAMDSRVDKDGKIVVCAWQDNRRVLVASNFVGIDPVDECKRYDRKQKKEITVPRPAIVTTYNKFMGGVDKADMMLSLYKTKFRSRKWYLRLVGHLLSVCAVNAWVIYRELGGTGSLLDYLVDISRSLLTGNVTDTDEEPPAKRPIRTLSSRHVPLRIRDDKVNHWPFQMSGGAQRCKNPGCQRRSRFMCSKCQVYLCVLGTACFTKFHGVDSSDD